METVFLRNRKLQDLQTSLQICNKICTDRDRAGFAQLCRIAIIIVVSQRREGRVAHWAASLQVCNKICTDKQRQALHSFAELQLFLQFYSAKQRRVGRGVHWATRGRCLQCLVAKILCVFNRLEPVRRAAVVLLRNRVGTSAPAFCVFCLAPCRQSADRCTVSEKSSIEEFCFKAKVFMVSYFKIHLF